MATPGSTAAHQLKGLPAFFSPSTRMEEEKRGQWSRRAGEGGMGRLEGKERIKGGPPKSPTKDTHTHM